MKKDLAAFLSLTAQEEQRQRPRAAVGSDDRSDVRYVGRLVPDRVGQHALEALRVLDAVAVGDEVYPALRVERSLDVFLRHRLEREPAPADLRHVDEVPLVVDVEDGLYAQHRRREARRRADAAAPLKIDEIIDGEPVADLRDGLGDVGRELIERRARVPALLGQIDEQPVPRRGAERVYDYDPAAGIFGLDLARGELSRAERPAQAGGEADIEHIAPFGRFAPEDLGQIVGICRRGLEDHALAHLFIKLFYGDVTVGAVLGGFNVFEGQVEAADAPFGELGFVDVAAGVGQDDIVAHGVSLWMDIYYPPGDTPSRSHAVELRLDPLLYHFAQLRRAHALVLLRKHRREHGDLYRRGNKALMLLVGLVGAVYRVGDDDAFGFERGLEGAVLEFAHLRAAAARPLREDDHVAPGGELVRRLEYAGEAVARALAVDGYRGEQVDADIDDGELGDGLFEQQALHRPEVDERDERVEIPLMVAYIERAAFGQILPALDFDAHARDAGHEPHRPAEELFGAPVGPGRLALVPEKPEHEKGGKEDNEKKRGEKDPDHRPYHASHLVGTIAPHGAMIIIYHSRTARNSRAARRGGRFLVKKTR